MSQAAEENLDGLEVQMDLRGDVFEYQLAGADEPVQLRAIHKRGLVDGIEDSRHAVLVILPGDRTGDDDTDHLPAEADSGDVATIDSVACPVINVVRRRGRFTRVTVQIG